MKRNLRFYFALLFAKGTALVLKLIGRKGTSMPGSWAIILCPDFIGRMPRPKTVIGITGTNGKTTVSNMVEDVLEHRGIDFMCNRSGTNVATGIASTLIANSTLFGKPKKDLAVFELDERSSPHIMPYMKPDLLLCTNIFRDSYKRNAHMEFILDLLEQYIPDTTKMIVNADDLLCAGLKKKNDRVYFSMDQLPGETAECHNIVRDIAACPHCGAPLSWDFVRYHHIGRAHCTACGFSSPAGDYRITQLNHNSHRMTVLVKGTAYEFPLLNESPINIYNTLSAIALLCEVGLAPETVSEELARLSISETRYQEEPVGDKKIILHLAKGQNPIACSRAFENIRDYPGKKSVVLFLDDYFDAKESVENISWYYDTDFEFLNDPSITQIVAAGARHWDVALRLQIAGVPQEKICHLEQLEQAAQQVNLDLADSVFLLYDVYTIGLASSVKQQLKNRLQEGTTHEN